MKKYILFGFIIFSIILLINSAFGIESNSNELTNIQKAINNTGADWTAKETAVSKLSKEQRKNLLGGLSEEEKENKPKTSNIESLKASVSLSEEENLSYFNWRDKDGEDWMTPIKNQNNCGSCWSFSPIAMVEAKANIFYNNPNLDPDLSEQSLISDCCSNCGDCNGGYSYYGLDYIRDIGIPDESCFPNSNSNSGCNLCENWESRIWKISGYTWGYYEINELKQTLIEKGPLNFVFTVYTDFYSYAGGVYTHTYGINEGLHYMTIVGFNDTNSTDGYFIVRNSWGSDWGEEGYAKIDYKELYGEYDTLYADYVEDVYSPYIDMDEDTVNDSFDICPLETGLVEYEGCPANVNYPEFSNWNYRNESDANDNLYIHVDITDKHGINSSSVILYYDYGDNGVINGTYEMYRIWEEDNTFYGYIPKAGLDYRNKNISFYVEATDNFMFDDKKTINSTKQYIFLRNYAPIIEYYTPYNLFASIDEGDSQTFNIHVYDEDLLQYNCSLYKVNVNRSTEYIDDLSDIFTIKRDSWFEYPLINETYLENDTNTYHIVHNKSSEAMTVLEFNKNFDYGDTIEFDINYIEGIGDFKSTFWLYGYPLSDVWCNYLECPSENNNTKTYIGNWANENVTDLPGIYHIKLDFLESTLKLTISDEDENEWITNIPLSYYWYYFKNTLGIGNIATDILHFTYSNFRITEDNLFNHTLVDNSNTSSLYFLPNYEQAGNYSLKCDVSDGLLEDSIEWRIIVNDAVDECFPNITSTNSACQPDGTMIETFSDLNGCYSLTTLDSDKIPEPVTHNCTYIAPPAPSGGGGSGGGGGSSSCSPYYIKEFKGKESVIRKTTCSDITFNYANNKYRLKLTNIDSNKFTINILGKDETNIINIKSEGILNVDEEKDLLINYADFNSGKIALSLELIPKGSYIDNIMEEVTKESEPIISEETEVPKITGSAVGSFGRTFESLKFWILGIFIILLIGILYWKRKL